MKQVCDTTFAPEASHQTSDRPTGNRTRNFCLEDRDDVRFTIEPLHKAEGKGFEPSSPHWWHALAVRPGKPYPATFRKNCTGTLA